MPETYQIVFLKAGDGSASAKKSVAEKIGQATKTPPDKILKQIEGAPFVYKKGLPRSKAEAISAALNKLGATTQVTPEEPVATAPAAPPGGFDFGAPPPPPGAGSGSSGFDFGAGPASGRASSPSGFDFSPPTDGGGGRPPGEEFAIEEPKPEEAGSPAAAKSGSNFGGFSFSPEAAVSTPTSRAPVSQVAVERNLDFAEASGQAAKAAPAARSGRKPETVTCPRCHHEQPPADECANCGVVLSKAGGAEPQAGARRPKVRVAQARSGSSAKTIAVGGVVVAVGLALAYFVGLFNPLLLKLAAGRDPVLRQYGVTVSPPRGKHASAAVGNPERAKEVREGFVERGRAIQAEIERLGALSDLAQFDQGARSLQAEVEAYLVHPANELLDHVRQVVTRYYTVQGIGLGLDGKTYMSSEMVELAGLAGSPDVEALPNQDEIRRALQAARDRVAGQEAARLEAERHQAVNVSFADDFEAGPAARWQKPAGMAVETSGGRLRLAAQPVALAQAARLQLFEPVANYVVEVTVTGSSADSSRAGLAIFQDAGSFVALIKARAGASETVQFMTQAGDGDRKNASGPARLRIERKGPYYTFSYWDAARSNWTQVDRFQPAWNEAPPRTLALVAFNGSGVFEFDDFALAVAP